MSRSRFPKLMTLALNFALTACGGGGGGGAGDEGGAPAGSSAQSNLESLTMDSRGLAKQTVPLADSDEEQFALARASEDYNSLMLEASVFGLQAVLAYADDEPFSCGGDGFASRHIRSETQTHLDMTVSLTRCALYSIGAGKTYTLNGTIRLVVDNTMSGETLEAMSLLYVFDLNGTNQAEETVKVLGDMSSVYIPLTSQTTITIPKLEKVEGDRYVAITDYRGGLHESDTEDSLSFKTNVVSSELGGRATFQTVTPLRMTGSASCPLGGVLQLSSADTVTLRFGVDTGTGESMVVEANNARLAGFSDCAAFGDFNPL